MKIIFPLPPRMRGIVLRRHDEDVRRAIAALAVEFRPMPKPQRGQVLVRIEAAPCNPSDLVFLQGRHDPKALNQPLPTVPGFEASGRVVAAGEGVLPHLLLGRRVACAGQSAGDGTWAEYFAVSATQCLPLKKAVSWELGATLLINPATALLLLQDARRGGHRAAIQNAAASQLGRMLIRLAARQNFPLINIVRRSEQAALLTKYGARDVLNSSDPDFEERLRDRAAALGASIAFDAVGGSETARLLNALPHGGHAVLFGALAGSAIDGIDPRAFLQANKTIRGFFLAQWLESAGFIGSTRTVMRLQKLALKGVFQTDVRASVPFEDFPRAVAEYADQMTRGKILLRPGMRKDGSPSQEPDAPRQP